MPPTPMALLKMKVTAFKDALDSKKASEKKGPISWAFAEDINRLIEEARKVEPAMAEHLPELIKFIDQGYGLRSVQHVDYIHVEIMLNRIIGTIGLFETND
jgi:hypothetical protein